MKLVAKYHIPGLPTIYVEDDEKSQTRKLRVGNQCLYSLISLDWDVVKQPVLTIPQEVAEVMSEHHPLRKALVLGAGGCTIPRFLSKRFGPQIQIDVVDISPDILDICKKHFLERIDMSTMSFIVADGFEYVRAYNADSKKTRYDYVFVDMFNASEQAGDITSEAFLRNLHKICSPGSTIVFNVFPLLNTRDCDAICDKIALVFFHVRAVAKSSEASCMIIATL